MIVRALVGLIKLYQCASPALGPRCRFTPSCSEYMREALMTSGFWRGMIRGTRRLLRCHPWHPGGIDPVPTSAEHGTRGSEEGKFIQEYHLPHSGFRTPNLCRRKRISHGI